MAKEEKPFDKAQGEEVEMSCDDKNWKMRKKWHRHGRGGTMGWIYFLGIIGTAVYYVQQISGFWMIVLAILKAIVWPAFLLYKVFTLLHM